jgi:hypothetical protein
MQLEEVHASLRLSKGIVRSTSPVEINRPHSHAWHSHGRERRKKSTVAV